jgi:hypothetical protein
MENCIYFLVTVWNAGCLVIAGCRTDFQSYVGSNRIKPLGLSLWPIVMWLWGTVVRPALVVQCKVSQFVIGITEKTTTNFVLQVLSEVLSVRYVLAVMMPSVFQNFLYFFEIWMYISWHSGFMAKISRFQLPRLRFLFVFFTSSSQIRGLRFINGAAIQLLQSPFRNPFFFTLRDKNRLNDLRISLKLLLANG